MAEKINREASDKKKGFRLQKLRAAGLLLDSIERDDIVNVYAAVECEEDVYVRESTESGEATYVEEDKNYNKDSKFTFNSDQVLNTMVSFVDIWIQKRVDSNIVFGFYTTVGIGKESKTKKIIENGIQLPDKPILELLNESRFEYENLIDAASKLIKSEYLIQYKKSENGDITTVKNFNNSDWIDFFKCIKWFFNEEDEINKEKEVLNKINRSKFYNANVVGRERFILDSLLELFDKRESSKSFIGKFVSSSDVETIYLRIGSQRSELAEDCSWKHFGDFDLKEYRNLKEKVTSVCPDYKKEKLSRMIKKVLRTKTEESKFDYDKSYLSLKYQILLTCGDLFENVLNNMLGVSVAEQQIDSIVKDLVEKCVTAVEDLAKDYRYTIKNKRAIEGIVLQLFDECYLNFEEGCAYE